MKISKQKLKMIIKEEMELAKINPPMQEMAEVDEEGRMAKRQLTDINEYSGKMIEMLNDDTQLEAWVQSKITLAADYIKTVKHYLEYEMKNGEYDQVTPETGAEDQEIR
jgi:serine protease inhibitor